MHPTDSLNRKLKKKNFFIVCVCKLLLFLLVTFAVEMQISMLPIDNKESVSVYGMEFL